MENQITNKSAISGVLIIIGLLAMLVMAVLPLFNVNLEWMRWAFAAGALFVLVGRILGYYQGPSLRIKRLHRILVTSGLLYCVSALMMFISRGTNDWIGFLLAGLVVQIYATWMIDYESKKSEK